MVEYTQEDLIRALQETGLKEGDICLVSTELFTLGRLKEARGKKEYCRMVLEAIFNVINKSRGTVVVNAFTTYVGRYGKPFDEKHSRPTTGVFSEYVTFHPESVRSLHPVNSVAAIGKHKNDICLNVSASNYGLDSPYDRLLKLNGQVLRLGIDPAHNSFLYVMETLYGVPYVYNKIFDVDVTSDGKKIEKQFLGSVRYLEYPYEHSFEKLKKLLEENHSISSAKLGAGFVHRLDANQYCRLVLSLLKEDPYALLKTPPAFVKGKIPRDGITARRDNVADSSDYNF